MSIRHKTSVISLTLIKQDLTNKVSIAMIDDAIKIIKQAEATEKAYQELQQDVDRYFELDNSDEDNLSGHEIIEWIELGKKLSKVDIEE